MKDTKESAYLLMARGAIIALACIVGGVALAICLGLIFGAWAGWAVVVAECAALALWARRSARWDVGGEPRGE